MMAEKKDRKNKRFQNTQNTPETRQVDLSSCPLAPLQITRRVITCQVDLSNQLEQSSYQHKFRILNLSSQLVKLTSLSSRSCHRKWDLFIVYVKKNPIFPASKYIFFRKSPLRCGPPNASPKVVHRPRSQSPLHFDIRNI